MCNEKNPSANLLAARRGLEGLDGVTLLDDWAADASSGKWVLHCRLYVEVPLDCPIPAATYWYVLVDEAYPWGSIKFYPSREGGISRTFPHQSYNDEGDSHAPWRGGDICLTTSVHVLGRHDFDSEPYGIHDRLRWHFARALDWLREAAKGLLVIPGEPFELPSFPRGSHIRVAYSENELSYSQWQNVNERTGLVDLLPASDRGDFFFTKCFRSLNGTTLITREWGTALTKRSEEPYVGLWLLLDRLPILPPWQAPTTWQELRAACQAMDVDIHELLKGVARSIRDGKQHFALVGFPIPYRNGESPVMLHWQAMLFPVLSYGNKTANGFRPNEKGYWRRDRRDVLAPDVRLTWLKSENWDVEQISTRGTLPQQISHQQVLLVGAGALGSVVAEMLVRAGMLKLTIIDGGVLEIGNLVRHPLGIEELGRFKANALAQRLNLASPHSTAKAIDENFPPSEPLSLGSVQECPLILDTTGDDALLHHLELFPWNDEKLFISLSLGFGAKRLFCFVSRGSKFPNAVYRDLIHPWLARESTENRGRVLPREGIGCWHPIFPARVDDISMMAATGVKYIERVLASPAYDARLVVFEQQYENRNFVGIRTVTAAA